MPAGRAVGVLRELFPEPAERAPQRMPRSVSVILQAAAVCAGVLVMLVRVPSVPVPPWESMYAEDFRVFFPQALQHPWHMLIPNAGYIELVPRLIAQFAIYVPLRYAAAVFAVSGAFTSAGCALFIFHASAGHVRSPLLRFILALAVLLLPVALIEIADSGVNSPWYMLFALFWAILWRPKTRTGMAVAVAIGFFTAASTAMAVVFLPLLLARLIAIPRLREHAVTAGWAAGCLLQAPFVLGNLDGRDSRAIHLAAPIHVLAFYGHGVVKPALGWHLGWHLQSYVGLRGTELIIGGILAVFFLWAMITQRGQARAFVATALITGFLFVGFAATLTWWVTVLKVTERWEPGSRYTTLPIYLIEAAAIVAVDSFIHRGKRRGNSRLRSIAAVAALVGILSVGWISDFRYAGRNDTANWPSTTATWLHACQRKPAGGYFLARITGKVRLPIPCASLRRL